MKLVRRRFWVAVAAAAATLTNPLVVASGADFNSSLLVGAPAASNGVTQSLMIDGFQATLSWVGDVDTSTFSNLTWKIDKVTNQSGKALAVTTDAIYAAYDESLDRVTFHSTGNSCQYGEQLIRAPWAGEQTDSDSSGLGFVGPVTWDATRRETVASSPVYSFFFDAMASAPTLNIYPCMYDLEDRKAKALVQGFVDSNGDGEVGQNETASPILEIVFLNENALRTKLYSTNLPGAFDVSMQPELELEESLNNWSTRFDWSTGLSLATFGAYELVVQQPSGNPGESPNVQTFPLSGTDKEFSDSGVDLNWGWTIAADGRTTYDPTFGDYGPSQFTFSNLGGKKNYIWMRSSAAVRVSNLATFGYVADSKIVKRSNTSAKMYAFDILNAGKVDFRHNGRVIASIDMVDEADPRALADGNRPYFVRTVNFVRGKNTLEVVVNGKVLKKHTYTLRSGMA